MSGPYQFPTTRFARENSLFRQWLHLVSEVMEVGLALLRRDYAQATRETWDVKHSSESLHIMLQERHGADVAGARVEVLAGNMERGYYA